MFCLPLVVLLTQALCLARGLRLQNPGYADTELLSQQDDDWPHTNRNFDETVDDGDGAESSLSDADSDLLDFDPDDVVPSLAELYGKVDFGLNDSETVSALDAVSTFWLDDGEDAAYEKETTPSLPTDNGLANMFRWTPGADPMPAVTGSRSGARDDTAIRDSGNATQATSYDKRANQSNSSRPLLSVSEYLADAYELCARSKAMQPHMPRMSKQALRQRYAVPQLVYKPYSTAMPVLYITAGGPHLKKFQAFFEGFSPDMVRIDAWIPSSRTIEGLKELVSDPQLLDRARAHVKKLGPLLSHLKAIKCAWDKGLNVALILEDDAIPLYPAWRSSLEDFVMTLPEDWEAAQLQWTGGPDTNFPQKFDVLNSSASSGPWVNGRAWGTAAYMIHRRGMKRLLSHLWHRQTQKFRLDKLVSSCKMMSADNCLLGFSGFPRNAALYEQVTWFPNKTEALTQVYLATPNLFVHNSFTSSLESRNFCEDLAQNTRLLQPQDPPPHNTNRLLIFLAANSTDNNSSTGLRRNLDYLRNQGFHVFVAHDMVNKDWAATPTTRKLKMLGITWVTFGKSWLQDYDYIWAIDEDIPLQSVNFSSAMESVVEADALITGPTLNDQSPSWDAPSRRFQRPDEECNFRYTNYVEAVAPVFQTKALGWVLQHMGRRLSSPAVMGTDLSWCRFLRYKASLEQGTAVRQRRELAVQNEGIRPCALMDRVTFTIDSAIDLLDNQTAESKKQALQYFEKQEAHFLVRDGIIERGVAFSEHCSETED